jgi:hypothetical protein
MTTGFERYTRKTRRALFLEEMEQVVPWRELCALVEPHYPKPGNGRPSKCSERPALDVRTKAENGCACIPSVGFQLEASNKYF